MLFFFVYETGDHVLIFVFVRSGRFASVFFSLTVRSFKSYLTFVNKKQFLTKLTFTVTNLTVFFYFDVSNSIVSFN